MHLHFLVTVPFWVGVILLVLRLLAAGNSTKGLKVPMIRREITAPDGRKAVFVVPTHEPPSVSIARMYPNGVIPTEATQGTAHQDRPRLAVSSEPQSRGLSPAQRVFWIGLAGIVVVAFLLSTVGSQSDRSSSTMAAPLSHQTAGAPTGLVRTSAPALPHVQLKRGANVRNGPSRSAAVLRVGQQGEVFTKFSEANGWFQVGTAQPEGWVAQSVATPVP